MCKNCQILRKHVRRLQDRNRLLAEVIADERKLRQAAWHTAWDWMQNKAYNAIFAIIHATTGFEKLQRKFEKETSRYLSKRN